MPRKPEVGGHAAAPVRARSARTKAQFEVFSAVLVAAGQLERELVEVLKTAGLSVAQYNVLRILRGAGAAGLACGQVGGRLIRHDPDVTRLTDRLEKRGLLERTREAADRRIVRTRITETGLALLAGLDEPIDQLHERQFGHMSERRLASLREVLVEATSRTG
jgi:MarR family transcriptional regulator, organic hydroperoxide resistance regulator